MICKDVTLAFFYPKREVVLEADASGRGLGAATSQNGHPIALASKSLTDVEQRYANRDARCVVLCFPVKSSINTAGLLLFCQIISCWR